MRLRRTLAVAALITTLLTLCALTTIAQAATIHVPADQPTIQAGINAASNGDTVLVAPGTYYENIDFMGKAITVTSSAGAATTIIDGSLNTTLPAVTMRTGESRASTLNGFTVQHGGSDLYYVGTSGGIYLNSASATLTNNIITSNNCYGIWIDASSPLIQNNEISNTNNASRDCGVAGGSGIYVDGAFGTPLGNSSLPPLILGNTIENNTQSIDSGGGAGGAGIAVWFGVPVMQNNILRNNFTEGFGGAVNFVDSGGFLIQNLIYNNQAACGAGAIYIPDITSDRPIGTFIANNTIVDNTYSSSNCSASNKAVVSQVYLDTSGFSVGSAVALVNNLISGSTGNPAIDCFQDDVTPRPSPATILADHNLFYNAGGPIFGNSCVDLTSTYGNFTAPPQFVNSAGHDYHLTALSPAIDAGNTSSLQFVAANGGITATDFDGNPRLEDATGKGYPIIDIGAYEFTGVQDANATTILLTPSQYAIDGGQSITLTAHSLSANGVPVGSLTFFEDGISIGTVTLDSTGSASQSVTLPTGIHRFIATYPGQGVFTPAQSLQTIVVVNKYLDTLSIASSLNPSFLGQPVTFTFTVTSADNTVLSPINVNINGTSSFALTPNSAGVATYTTSTLSIGSNSIIASYSGDSMHFAVNTSIAQQVITGYPTTTFLISSLNPSVINQSVTFSASVSSSSGTPTGSITFSDGATTLGTQTLDAFGHASFSTSTLSIGSHTITATYVPTGSFATSSNSLTQQVLTGYPTTTTLTSSVNPAAYHQSVTLTATLASPTATPLGTLTLSDGATILASETIAAPGWPALTFTSSTLTAGTHNLTVIYTPGTSATTAGSSATLALVIQPPPTTTSLTATPTATTSFQTITLTATVAPGGGATGTPAGTVTFFSGSTSLGPATLNATGTATLPVNLPAGTYSFTAQYAGTASFTASASSSVPVTVARDDTTIMVHATPNPQVQNGHIAVSYAVIYAHPLPPAVSYALAPGSTTIYDGATATANPDTTIPQTAGTHNITAVFSGDANFNPSTSAIYAEVITPQDFTLSAPPITIQTQHHAPLTLTITTVGGLTDTLSLSCGNLPLWATCTLTQPNFPLNNNAATASYTTTLNIDTDEIPNFAALHPTPKPGAPQFPIALSCGLLLSLIALRHRTPIRLVLLLLAATTLALSGCSGLYPSSTAPGTYSLQITGTTATSQITHSISVALTVTP